MVEIMVGLERWISREEDVTLGEKQDQKLLGFEAFLEDRKGTGKEVDKRWNHMNNSVGVESTGLHGGIWMVMPENTSMHLKIWKARADENKIEIC